MIRKHTSLLALFFHAIPIASSWTPIEPHLNRREALVTGGSIVAGGIGIGAGVLKPGEALAANGEAYNKMPSVTMSKTDTYSDLFDDVDAMLELSALVYSLAELSDKRQDEKLREGIDTPDFLDVLPKTSSEVIQWTKRNSELVEGSDFDLSYLQDILKRDEIDKTAAGTLEVFDDDYAFEGRRSEIVYGITKNPDKKRISVVFRGSSTTRDWLQNFRFLGDDVEFASEAFRKTIPNVNLDLLGEFEEVRLQRGFFRYLFVQYTKDERGGKTEPPKFVQMMGHIQRLLKENPDYELYFSGHSLGGALATLAATAASLSDDIKKPVKLISLASPQVGKSDFVKVAQNLQQSKNLVHVRVTNHEDLVPQLNGPIGYRHFGLHLNLFDKKYDLSFDQGGMRLPLPWRALDAHSLAKTNERLLKAKSDIEKYDIDTVFDTIKAA